jgi:hypothetical protein
MNIFESVHSSFSDPLLEYRVRNISDELFGSGDSYIKNLFILTKYRVSGGSFDSEPNIRSDYKEFKAHVEEQISFATNSWFINKQIDYASSFIDSEDDLIRTVSWEAVEDLARLWIGGFTRTSFDEVFNKNLTLEANSSIPEVAREEFISKFNNNISEIECWRNTRYAKASITPSSVYEKVVELLGKEGWSYSDIADGALIVNLVRSIESLPLGAVISSEIPFTRRDLFLKNLGVNNV